MRHGREVMGGLSGETEMKKRDKEAAANIGFGGGEDVGELANDVAQRGDDYRRPAGSVEVARDVV